MFSLYCCFLKPHVYQVHLCHFKILETYIGVFVSLFINGDFYVLFFFTTTNTDFLYFCSYFQRMCNKTCIGWETGVHIWLINCSPNRYPAPSQHMNTSGFFLFPLIFSAHNDIWIFIENKHVLDDFCCMVWLYSVRSHALTIICLLSCVAAERM